MTDKPVPERKHVLKTFCTTREAAQLLGVSLRTAQLWTEAGLLEAWKTEGGHRRISRESIERLLVNPAVTAQAGREEEAPAGKTASPRRPLSVLVVEDEPTTRRLYEARLSSWAGQPRISLAGNGYEGLVRIGLDRPDLLITDLLMPGMDGFRMLEVIRAQPELAAMEIVVVTGLTPADIEARGGLPAGIRVLPKPVPFEELATIATRIEAGRRRHGRTGEAKS